MSSDVAYLQKEANRFAEAMGTFTVGATGIIDSQTGYLVDRALGFLATATNSSDATKLKANQFLASGVNQGTDYSGDNRAFVNANAYAIADTLQSGADETRMPSVGLVQEGIDAANMVVHDFISLFNGDDPAPGVTTTPTAAGSSVPSNASNAAPQADLTQTSWWSTSLINPATWGQTPTQSAIPGQPQSVPSKALYIGGAVVLVGILFLLHKKHSNTKAI